MRLGIVQTIWSLVSDLVSSILNLDLIFYIGVGFLILMSIFFFIRIRMSYEFKLEKTADRLNAWLFKNQTITDQNLVEFNEIMKERRTPKILRKYWQQYMLYRDKQPSEYMSTYNCIDKPVKTNSFNSNISNFKIIYKLTAFVTFFFSMFAYTGNTASFATQITHSLIASTIVLIIGVILTVVLKAIESYNIATLYQTFSVFSRYIDKACTTMPKSVNFEILFTKKEIKEGIPLLGEYLEKRARQEQEELDQAQKYAVAHEEYDFASAGINGELLLERAMKESETYLNIQKRLNEEIAQYQSDISTLKNNYDNTTKEYMRKMQASKENVERLRQQLEQSTNRIDVNYIRKQQQDIIKQQEKWEQEQESATLKFNEDVANNAKEIEKRQKELEIKKEHITQAMLSEYQTFSTKVHKAVSDDVEKSKNDAIQEIVNEKNQYAQAISYLKNEIESKDAQLLNKDKTITDLFEKFKSFAEGKLNSDEIEQLKNYNKQETDEQDGYYDDKGYYWFNNGTYYDDKNLYHDLEGNVYDENGELKATQQEIEQDPKTITKIIDTAEASLNVDSQEQVQVLNLNEQQNEVKEDEAKQQTETEKRKPGRPKKVSEENAQQEPKRKVGRPKKEIDPLQQQEPKRKPGRPKKNVEETISETEKRKPGRPKKVIEQNVQKEPKRKVGRPKKITEESEQKTEKRKPGRPKKTTQEINFEPKRKAGRPKKEELSKAKTSPKRRATRQ